MKRNGIEVELRIPMEAKFHGKLEDEATNGEDGNEKGIEQHHFDPPNAMWNVTASRG